MRASNSQSGFTIGFAFAAAGALAGLLYSCSSGSSGPDAALGGSSTAGGSAGAAGAGMGGSPAEGGTGGGAAVAGSAGNGGSGGGGSGGSAGAGGSAGGPSMLPGKPVVYVGGYGTNYPLRAFDLNETTGALTPRGGDFDAGNNPSYLALNSTRTHLYAANELDNGEGGITALAIQNDGSLTTLNHRSGSDGGYCHLAVHPSGKFVIGASYNGGSVSVFPINADGSLGPELDTQDFGDGAQAHAVDYAGAGKYLLVPTKGNDRVEQLMISETGMLSLNTPAFVMSADGAGPRHIAIHPQGKLAFVINELANSVTPYQLAEDGTLTPGTTLSSLPQGYQGGGSGAHIELSPDGRFVYASNRGHDSIVVYQADQTTGALTLIEHEPTRGQTPRDFDVDPNGKFLIVANQGSNNLSVYRIEDNGALTPLGTPSAAPPQPAAVQIHYVSE
jgi:6-phosphogluconolactonase